MTDFNEYLRLEEDSIVCGRCGERLAAAGENFKRGTRFAHRPLVSLTALNIDPTTFIDDEIVLREFYCPGCGGLLANELCKESDAPRHDVHLAAPGGR